MTIFPTGTIGISILEGSVFDQTGIHSIPGNIVKSQTIPASCGILGREANTVFYCSVDNNPSGDGEFVMSGENNICSSSRRIDGQSIFVRDLQIAVHIDQVIIPDTVHIAADMISAAGRVCSFTGNSNGGISNLSGVDRNNAVIRLYNGRIECNFNIACS